MTERKNYEIDYKLKFRNYKPIDEGLQMRYQPYEISEQKTEELLIKELEPILKETQQEFVLAPHQANADLKRDLQKKMNYLNKKTQEVISELLLQKMEEDEEEDEEDEEAE
jgi:dipeptidase